ncbi:MAG: hypothetical protein ACKO6B_03620 [Planctomycetia bacterium]
MPLQQLQTGPQQFTLLCRTPLLHGPGLQGATKAKSASGMVKLSRTSRTLGVLAGFSGEGVGDGFEVDIGATAGVTPDAAGAGGAGGTEGVTAGLAGFADVLTFFLAPEDAETGARAGRLLAALTGLAVETGFAFIWHSRASDDESIYTVYTVQYQRQSPKEPTDGPVTGCGMQHRPAKAVVTPLSSSKLIIRIS